MAAPRVQNRPRASGVDPTIVEVEVGHRTPQLVRAVIALDGSDPTPAFSMNGAEADVFVLERDGQGRPMTALIQAPVTIGANSGGGANQFATVNVLPSVSSPAQAVFQVQVPTISIELVGTDGQVYSARPLEAAPIFFWPCNRGTAARWSNLYSGVRMLASPSGGERVLALVDLDSRADGLCEVEVFLVNGAQTVQDSAPNVGDFTFLSLRVIVSWLGTDGRPKGPVVSTFMPRAGETTIQSDARTVISLVDDGAPHLWERSIGRLLRFAVAPPGTNPVETHELAHYFGYGFPTSGPRSFFASRSHGPEQGRLAPWGPTYNLWGPIGQAAARAQLDSDIGAFATPRAHGTAIGPFTAVRTGLFHKSGIPDEGPGAPGGQGIRPTGTFALDRRLLVHRRLELEHRVDRFRRAHLKPDSGAPTDSLAWARRFGGTVPFAWANAGDRQFPWLRYPRDPQTGGIVRTGNVKLGTLAPVDALEVSTQRLFDADDDAHGVRMREPAETLARFSGTSAPLRVLQLVAATAMLARHPYPHASDGVACFAAMDLLAHGVARPLEGDPSAGRGLAWDLRAIAGWASFANSRERSAMVPTVSALLEYFARIRPPTGWLQSDAPMPQGHNSYVAIHDQGAPAGYRYAQTFELAYLELAIEATLQAFEGTLTAATVEDARRGSLRSMDSLIGTAVERADGLVATFLATAVVDGHPLPAPDGTLASNQAEATWIFSIAAAAARTAERLGISAAEIDARLARVLRVGVGAAHAYPSYSAYVAAAQALEKEPWHGSWTFAALAWGQAVAADQPQTTRS